MIIEAEPKRGPDGEILCDYERCNVAAVIEFRAHDVGRIVTYYACADAKHMSEVRADAKVVAARGVSARRMGAA